MADTKMFYAITAGMFEDYHVVAITDDKEHAEELHRVIPDSDVEEFPNVTMIPRNAWIWHVARNNGTHSVTVSRNNSEFSFKKLNVVDEIPEGYYTSVFVMALNEPHALKIAYNLFAQHDAEKAGIT